MRACGMLQAWLARTQPQPLQRHANASPISTKPSQRPLSCAFQPCSTFAPPCATQRGPGRPVLDGAPDEEGDLQDCFDLDGSRAGNEDPGTYSNAAPDRSCQVLSSNTSALNSHQALLRALRLLMATCCPHGATHSPSSQQQQRHLLRCLETAEAAATRLLEEEGLPATTNRKGSREAGRRYARRKEKRWQRRARAPAAHPAELQLHSFGSKERTASPVASRTDWTAMLRQLQALGVRIGPALELVLYREVQPWSNAWPAGAQHVHNGAADSGDGKGGGTSGGGSWGAGSVGELQQPTAVEEAARNWTEGEASASAASVDGEGGGKSTGVGKRGGEDAAACVPGELAQLVCCVCLLPAPSHSPPSSPDGYSNAPATPAPAITAPLPAVTANEEEAARQERAGSHAHASTSSLPATLKRVNSSSGSSTPIYTAPLGMGSTLVAPAAAATAGAVPGVKSTEGMLEAAARTVRHQWLNSALRWLMSLPTGSSKAMAPQQQQQQQQGVRKQTGGAGDECCAVPLAALVDVVCALVRSDHQVAPGSSWLPQLYASTLLVLQQQQKQQVYPSMDQVERLAWAVSKLVQAGAPPPPGPWLQALEALLLSLCTRTTLELHQQQRLRQHKLRSATAEQALLHQQQGGSTARPALSSPATHTTSQASPQPPPPPLSPTSSSFCAQQVPPPSAPSNAPGPLPHRQASSFVLYPPNSDHLPSPSTSPSTNPSTSLPSPLAADPSASAACASSAARSCVAMLVSLTHIHLAGESPGKAAAGEAGGKGRTPSPLTLCALSHCAAAASAAGLLPLSSYAELLWALARLQWHPGEDWLASVSAHLLAHAASTRAEPVTGEGKAMGIGAEAKDGAGSVGSSEQQQVLAGIRDLQQQQQQQQQQEVLAGVHDRQQKQQQQQQLHDRGKVKGLSGAKAAQALWALAVLLEQPPSPRQARQHRHHQRMFEQQLQAQHRQCNQQQPGLHEHDSDAAQMHDHAQEAQPPAAPSPTHARAVRAWLQLLLPALEAEPPTLMGPTSMVTLLWSLATLAPLLAAQQHEAAATPAGGDGWRASMPAQVEAPAQQQANPATQAPQQQADQGKPFLAPVMERPAAAEGTVPLPPLTQHAAVVAHGTEAEAGAPSTRLTADTQARVVDLLHVLLPACARTLHATSPHMVVMALWSAARLLPVLPAAKLAPQQPTHGHESKDSSSSSSSSVWGSSTVSREGSNVIGSDVTSESTSYETSSGTERSGSSSSSSSSSGTAAATSSTSSRGTSSSAEMVELVCMLGEVAAGLVGRSAPMLTPQDLVTAGRALVDVGWQGADWGWMAVFAYACRSKLHRMQPDDHAGLLEAVAQLAQLHQRDAAHSQQQQQQQQRQQQQLLPPQQHLTHMQKKLGAAARRVGMKGSGDGVQELAELGVCSAAILAQAIMPLQPHHHQQQEQEQEGWKHAAAGAQAQEVVHLLGALNALLHTLLLYHPPSSPPPRTWSAATTTRGAAAAAADEDSGSKAVTQALCDALREVLAAAEGRALQELMRHEQTCLHHLPSSREQVWAVWDKVQLLGAAADLRTCTKAWLKHCGWAEVSPTAPHSPTMSPAAPPGSSPFAPPPSSPHDHAGLITRPFSSATYNSSGGSSSVFTSPSIILTPTSNPQAPLLIRPRPPPPSHPSSPPSPSSSSLSSPSPQSSSSQTPKLPIKPQPADPSSSSTALLAQQLHAAIALPSPASPLLPPPPPALSGLLSACAPSMLQALQQLTEFNPLGNSTRETGRGPPSPAALACSLVAPSDLDEGLDQDKGSERVALLQQQEATHPQPPMLRSGGRAGRASRAQHAAPLGLLMHAHAVWRAPVAPLLLLEAHRLLSPRVPSPPIASQLLQALAMLHYLRLLPGPTPPPAASHAPETAKPTHPEPFHPAVAAEQGNTTVASGLSSTTFSSSPHLPLRELQQQVHPSAVGATPSIPQSHPATPAGSSPQSSLQDVHHQPLLSTLGDAAPATGQHGWRPGESTGAASRSDAYDSSSSSSSSSLTAVSAPPPDSGMLSIAAGVHAQLQITSLLTSSWLNRGPYLQPQQGAPVQAPTPAALPAHILSCLNILAAGLHHTPQALLPNLLPRLLHFLAKHQQQQQQQQQQAHASRIPSPSPLSPSFPRSSSYSSMDSFSLSPTTSVSMSSSRSSTRRSSRGKSSGSTASLTSAALWMSHSVPAHPTVAVAVLRQLQAQVWQECMHAPLLHAAVPARDLVSLLHGLARLRWLPPQAWHQSSRPRAFRQALLHLCPPGPPTPPSPTHPVHLPPPPHPTSALAQPPSHTLPVELQRPQVQDAAVDLGPGDLCCLLWSLSSLHVPLPSSAWLAACYRRVAAAVSAENGGHKEAVAVESWVCLVWAVARLSGAASPGAEEGSLQANSRSGTGNRSSASGMRGKGTVWGADGVVWEDDGGRAQLGLPGEEGEDITGHSSEDAPSSSPVVAACGWLPVACAQIAAGVGGLSGSSLGCVVWGSGVLLEEVTSELLLGRAGSGMAWGDATEEGACMQQSADDSDDAAEGGSSVGSDGASSASSDVAVGGEGLAHSKQQQQREGSGRGADSGDAAGLERGGGKTGTTQEVVAAVLSLARLQAAAYGEIQSRLIRQQPDSSLASHTPESRAPVPAAAAAAADPTALPQAPSTQGPSPSAAPPQASLPQTQASPAAAAAAVAPEARAAAPETTAAAAPRRKSRWAKRRSSDLLQRAGLPLSAVLAACAGALQGCAALRAAASAGLPPHMWSTAEQPTTPNSSASHSPPANLEPMATHSQTVIHSPSAATAPAADSVAGLSAEVAQQANPCDEFGSRRGGLQPGRQEELDLVSTAQLLGSSPALPQVMLDGLVSGLAANATPRQGVSCLSMLARFRVRPPKELRLQLYALLLPPLMAAARRRPAGFHYQQQQQQEEEHLGQQQQPQTGPAGRPAQHTTAFFGQGWEGGAPGQAWEGGPMLHPMQTPMPLQPPKQQQQQQQQLDTSSVLSISLSLARLRMRPPPPMSSVLVRALVAALPFMDTRPGPHAAPVHGAAFGHAVWALAKLGAQLDGPAAAVLLEEVSRRLRLRALSSPALVHVLWGLAKLSVLQTWHPAEPLLRTLFARILEVVPELGVTDISRVVWAAASLDAKPPALLLHALTARALPGMRSATPHTLTTLLYGLAALGYRPPPAFFTAFFRATAAAMRRTPAKAKNPTDINNTHDCGSSRSSQKGSRVASKTGSNRGLLGSSQPLPVAGSSHVTGRGLARTLWALATLQKDPPSTWLTLATRRLVQELPSCNAHDLTLAALGCAVLGPSLGTRQVSAFGAAVERQRRRRLAMQYERDKVAMVWAWGRLRARIQIDQEEKQRKPQVKGLQQRLRHAASAAQRKANK